MSISYAGPLPVKVPPPEAVPTCSDLPRLSRIVGGVGKCGEMKNGIPALFSVVKAELTHQQTNWGSSGVDLAGFWEF